MSPVLKAPVVKPIVKWAGGKTKLLPELVARLPPTWGRYFEPFAGGAALFFYLATLSSWPLPGGAVLGDMNADLVQMYQTVAESPVGVARALTRLRREHERRAQHCYSTMRSLWNDRSAPWKPIERAAAFIYLNRACFNGLWRVNRKGEFNVPMGDYDVLRLPGAPELRAAGEALARARVACGGYQETVLTAERGDLVYFDPPYDPVAAGSFTAYTGAGFGDQQQAELADVVRQLAARGVRVLLSNSDTPKVRKLYHGLRIDRVTCPRAINSAKGGRGKVNEVIVVAGHW